MITAWRICRTKFAGTAFSGEGAFRHGGRWNSPGYRVVYLAGSLALGQLEILVHVNNAADLRRSYAAIAVEIPEHLVQEQNILPKNWRRHPSPPGLAKIGNGWIQSRSSAILRVPSVISRTETLEYNYLLNPGHADFTQVRFGRPQRIAFDPRITRLVER